MASRFSVVIATHDRPALLRRAVQSVVEAAKGHDVDIVVVDDHSQHPVPADIHQIARVIEQSRNTGPGPARMRGLESTDAEFAIILDDDDELRADAFHTLEASIAELPEDQIVCQFATSESQLPQPRVDFGLQDYLSGQVRGDFTPLIRTREFISHGYRYPNIRIGGEHLLWWEIASRHGIPTFNEQIARVNHDAEMRLTSPQTQILKADQHLQLNRMTLEKYGALMRQTSPYCYTRTVKALITYALLSGNRRIAVDTLLREQFSLKSRLLFLVLLSCPTPVIKSLFRAYRRQNETTAH